MSFQDSTIPSEPIFAEDRLWRVWCHTRGGVTIVLDEDLPLSQAEEDDVGLLSAWYVPYTEDGIICLSDSQRSLMREMTPHEYALIISEIRASQLRKT